MENISVKVLLEDLKKSSEDFEDSCDSESEKSAMSLYLSDNINLGYDFPEGELYKLVDAYREKGDGRDEETLYGIFLRKSDEKHFRLWVHDAGFIGPATLTMCDYIEEVKSMKKTEWKKM